MIVISRKLKKYKFVYKNAKIRFMCFSYINEASISPFVGLELMFVSSKKVNISTKMLGIKYYA